MFKNTYPLFERKRLLKKEMLENLRDYPRDIFQILYQDMSDGILAGCNLSTDSNGLLIQPGIILYKKISYILDKPWSIPYEANGKMSYLKLRFLEKDSGIGQDEYLSQVHLDDIEPNEHHEIELARFKLQQGARLRTEYVDFFDYKTEFDTVNRIYVPYASIGRSSIIWDILVCYAETLMCNTIQNPWDYSFCMNCLHLKSAMPYKEIQMYLNVRLNQNRLDYSNIDIYDSLGKILLEMEGRVPRRNQAGKNNKKLLLL